jgi:hypothetical protein
MRSRLMFPDRDFDSSGRFTELMYRFRKPDNPERLPFHQECLVEDLDLDTLVRAMAAGDEFLLEVAREALLAGARNDVETILYRQEALRDCLQEREVIRRLYALAVEAIDGTRKTWWSFSTMSPASRLYDALQTLNVLCAMLRNLRTIAELHGGRFRSKALCGLFALVTNELGEEYLRSIEACLADLEFRNGILLSAKLGEYNESSNLSLRVMPDAPRGLVDRLFRKRSPGFTFRLAERDQVGAQILSEMRQRGIMRVAIALVESADHVLGFFRSLRTELAFYVGCLNLHERLSVKGEPVCFPAPGRAGERTHSFRGLYDVSLSLRCEGSVVGTSADAEGKALVVITGANQGGKSTFLRSIGIAQMMMQCGMFAGAESFSAEVCPGVFTHYKREEDATMTSGKFDEEMARFSAMADLLAPNSLVLFNESFAATNEREGSEIATQIVDALLERHIKVFFVTHLYEFARAMFARNSKEALFLRAERRTDGTRTFEMKPGEPLRTSHGQDLYRHVFHGSGEQQGVAPSPSPRTGEPEATRQQGAPTLRAARGCLGSGHD